MSGFVNFEKSIDQCDRLSRVSSDQGDPNTMVFLKEIMILKVKTYLRNDSIFVAGQAP